MKWSTTTTPARSSTTRSSPTNDPDERRAYVALALIDGLGPRRIAQLLSAHGSAQACLTAPSHDSSTLTGFPRTLVRALHHPPLERADALVAECLAHGHFLLTPADEDFPALLRSIPDPPPILFARGNLALTNRPAVAIVGSRDHTRYGGEVAERLGQLAAAAGLVVVSGMARGLDAVAQRAALEAGGASIGVLGAGVDVVYPARNRALYELILRDGLLLSESPAGTRPEPGSFPRRNRLISGLALALVVVEAADGSGTLITVGSALEQGREVLAVPGPITSPTSRGTNRLLRDGAIPLLEPEDMLVALGLPSEARPLAPPTVPCTLSPTEARVLAALGPDSRGVDDLAEAVGLPVGELLAALLGLELGGLAQQLPGALYRRRGP
ncbi:MAG: DNA-processing protein DprA [Gemmatimonadota bacterium]